MVLTSETVVTPVTRPASGWACAVHDIARGVVETPATVHLTIRAERSIVTSLQSTFT